MESKCKSAIPGCLLIASSGAAALASLLAADPVAPLVYTVALLSLGLTVYKIHGLREVLVVSASTGGLVAFSLAAPGSLYGFILYYAILAYITVRSGVVEATLAYWPLILVPAYYYGGPGWIGVFASSIILFSSTLSYLETGRGHSLMITVVSPIAAAVNPEVSLAASASTLALAVVLSGIVERTGCPFTRDSGMVFIGVFLSITGVVMGLLGGPFQEYWLTVWLVGFLYTEAGVLVPQGIPHRSSS